MSDSTNGSTTGDATTAASLATLAGRVDALERTARRWRAAAVIVGLVGVLGVSVGAGGNEGEVIHAKAFIVHDESGKPIGGFSEVNGNALLLCTAVRANDFGVVAKDRSPDEPIALFSGVKDSPGEAILELRGKSKVSRIFAGSASIEVSEN